MNLQVLKSKIGYTDVFDLLYEVGAEPIDRGTHIESLTVCHHGDSHKLYFYKDTLQFMCFTQDGSFDIISFVEKTMDKNLSESINYLKNRYHITDEVVGEFVESNDFKRESFNPLVSIKQKEHRQVDLKVFNKSVLNTFYDYPHKSWIDEGITVKTIRKFDIKYDIMDNRIIIPHFDIKGDLVGIRARNLNEDIVNMFGKYTPIKKGNDDYRYQTGENLYGININKEVIQSSKVIILFEAEKSVLLMDSIYGESPAVALNGTMLTSAQIDLIDSLGVEEVVVAVDKEYEKMNDEKSIIYAQKVQSIFGKLKNKHRVSILWDRDGLIKEKDSPIDEGKSVFEQLYRERIFI